VVTIEVFGVMKSIRTVSKSMLQ